MEGSKSPGNCSSSENGSLDWEIASVDNDCGDSCSSSGCVNDAAVIRDHPPLYCDSCGCVDGDGSSLLELGTSLLALN